MKNSSLSTNNVTLITAIYLNLSYEDNLALNIKQGCWWTIKSLIVFISFRFLYLLFSMLSRRSCVLRDIFFPTYSYIFFQWKIFQICPQDFRLFIPPTWPHFGPPDPGFRVRSKARRLRPDQVNYWEGALQLLFYKLCLKMIVQRSRSTSGPGPSGSENVICPH